MLELEPGVPQRLDANRIAVQRVMYDLVVLRAEIHDAAIRAGEALETIRGDVVNRGRLAAYEAAKACYMRQMVALDDILAGHALRFDLPAPLQAGFRT